MHINEVERILKDSVSGQERRYEIKRYCDHICCESDFVLLRDGLEYAYFKFDETGRMSKKDDLNMWRLYGDDSKGVCLWYKVDDELPDHFFLAKVSYAKNEAHAELSYLSSKMGKGVCGRNFEIRNLNSWLHFFKPSEYAVEEEVRLLYEMNDGSLFDTTNGKWIYNTSNGIIAPIVRFPITKVDSRFPLVLERIVLGPNLKERGINKEQLLLMLKYGQINVTDNFEITYSDINSYR